MKPQVAKLLGIPDNTPVTVTFEWDDFPDAFHVAANIEPESVEHFMGGMRAGTDK